MLETPAIGADAASIATDNAGSSPAQTPPSSNAAQRRRPSDFSPDLSYTPQEDPSRFERKLDGSAGGDPDDVGGLASHEDDLTPADQEVDAQEAKRQEVAEKFLEQLRAGALKFDDFKDTPIEFSGPNGQPVKMSLNDLYRGNLRQADYTRKLIDMQRVQGDAQNLLRLERGRRQEWQNPQLLRRGLDSMGLGNAVQQMIDMHVHETVQFRKLPPERQQQIQAQQQIEQMKAMYEQQLAQYQQALQQQQAPQEAAVTQHIESMVTQHAPAMLKQAGLNDSHPKVRQWFLESLHGLYDGGEVTPELIQAAVDTTAQLWGDRRAEAMAIQQNQAAARQQGGALPARRGYAPGNGQSLSMNGKRSRPSAFGQRFNSHGL